MNDGFSADAEQDMLAAERELAVLLARRWPSGRLRRRGQRCYPYSCIRFLDWESDVEGTKRFFLKRVDLPNKTRKEIAELLKQEEELNVSLSKTMEHEVVEVVAVFPSLCVIVTLECPGRPLESYLGNRLAWWRGQLLPLAEKAGDWLRRFHRASARGEKVLLDWFYFLTGEMEWRSRQLGERLPGQQALFRSLVVEFEKQLLALDAKRPTCLYHGDFAPHNLFVHGGRLCAIDFSAAREGVGVMDVVNWIGWVGALSERSLFPSWRLERFLYRFWTAYALNGRCDLDLMPLLLVLQVAKRAHLLSEKGETPAFHAYLRYLERFVEGDGQAQRRGPWPGIDLGFLFVC